MALTVKHNFVSPIADQGDPTLFGPDEWNDTHALSMATNKLLGRATAGAGAIEEITLGTNLSFTGTTLDATGGSPSAPSGSVQYNNGSFGGDASFTYGGNGAVTVGSSGHTASVALTETGGNAITLQPGAATGAYTFKFPTSGGTNGYVLQTNGAGVTSWVLQTGATGSLTVGTTTITGGTTKHVVYDNAGVVGEAANFTIESGNPNVTAGNAYEYDGQNIITAIPGQKCFFFGGGGNLTVTGTQNYCLGDTTTLTSLTSGGSNVAIGDTAGQSINSGSNNVCVGDGTGVFLTTQNDNTNVGFLAGAFSTGTGNTYIGSSPFAGVFSATGSYNVGIGVDAAKTIGSGQQNVAIGHTSLMGSGGGNPSNNFAMGTGSLLVCSGNSNVAIGTSAGVGVTTGGYNIIFGDMQVANDGITSGTGNIVIGAANQVPTGTASNQLVIGNYIYGTGLAGTGSTISSGKIGIGVKAPANELDVAGAISLTTFIEGTEMSAPAAPAANGFRIFAQDNGAGKTQLMVIFNTGAAQQIAIQP